MRKRVYIDVSGGVVQYVDVPTEVNGTWTVIDWDNIENAPKENWQHFDEEDRAYVREKYPDDFQKYFAEFEA